MSAATAALHHHHQQKAKTPRGFVKVSHRFFTEFLFSYSYCEAVVCGIILDRTVGWQQEWAAITWKEFTETTRTTKRAVADALWKLQQDGVIERRQGARSDEWWYRTADRTLTWEAPDTKPGWVRCDRCRHVVEAETASNPMVPHSFFLRLPRAVGHAEWVVAGIVFAMTLGSRKLEAEISVGTLCEVSGLTRRAVQEALNHLEDEHGIIERQLSPGKHSILRINVDRFCSDRERPKRTVHRKPREDRAQVAKSTGRPAAEGGCAVEFPISEPTPESRNPERLVIWCPHCQSVATGVSVESPGEPKPPGKASAGARSPEWWADLEGFLGEVGQAIGRTLPAKLVQRIGERLHSRQHLGAFVSRVRSRLDYLRRQAQHPGAVLVKLAAEDLDSGAEAPVDTATCVSPPAQCARCGDQGASVPWNSLGELRDLFRRGEARLCGCERGRELWELPEDEIVDPATPGYRLAWILEEFPALAAFAAGVRARRAGVSITASPADDEATGAEWRRGWKAAERRP